MLQVWGLPGHVAVAKWCSGVGMTTIFSETKGAAVGNQYIFRVITCPAGRKHPLTACGETQNRAKAHFIFS
jgi:hypothetical protein